MGASHGDLALGSESCEFKARQRVACCQEVFLTDFHDRRWPLSIGTEGTTSRTDRINDDLEVGSTSAVRNPTYDCSKYSLDTRHLLRKLTDSNGARFR
jgi:hypothetical protein